MFRLQKENLYDALMQAEENEKEQETNVQEFPKKSDSFRKKVRKKLSQFSLPEF